MRNANTLQACDDEQAHDNPGLESDRIPIAPNRREPTAASGRLILVLCADPGWLDLILEAARSRLEHLPGLGFAMPVSTRSLPAGGGVAVKRSGFNALLDVGGLALSWRSDARDYGYTIALSARLSQGETVVAGATVDVVAEARRHWHDVRFIRLAASTDKIRAPLAPRACLSRLAGPRERRQPALGRLLLDRCEVVVDGEGAVAPAVQRLVAAIEALSSEGRRSRKTEMSLQPCTAVL